MPSSRHCEIMSLTEFDAFTMSGNAGKAAEFSPSPVAVHNNGDVLRQEFRLQFGGQFAFRELVKSRSRLVCHWNCSRAPRRMDCMEGSGQSLLAGVRNVKRLLGNYVPTWKFCVHRVARIAAAEMNGLYFSLVRSWQATETDKPAGCSKRPSSDGCKSKAAGFFNIRLGERAQLWRIASN
jgi:hypothetical protein